MDVLRDSLEELRSIEAALTEEEAQLREIGYQMAPHSIKMCREHLHNAILCLLSAGMQRERDKKEDLRMQKMAGVAQ